ncbi:hypothetical protein I0C86_41460 [Plantactinospora sp. S1510]|uniref:Uncharacterized protein n=1 Tax=Plantactinospora alkalitolerans TaxID=2789879 RepID=A0ABS0HA12_9ACTN|nr:hypothetical protein [Plantactinospora alkalitolerans]MBF9135321.1 hypothetical protein [Plantactinospora alkalitolerans]
MTSYATVNEITKLTGPLTSEQQTQVADLLARASAMLRGAVPDLQERLISGEVDPVNASTAVINMVLRVMRNPQGLTAETVGPFRREWERDSSTAWLSVTQAELDLVAKPAEKPRARASTIRVRAGLAPPGPCWGSHVRRW